MDMDKRQHLEMMAAAVVEVEVEDQEDSEHLEELEIDLAIESTQDLTKTISFLIGYQKV